MRIHDHAAIGDGRSAALEPPGFLALHYGTRTPVSVVLAHLVYGMILGTFYALPRG